MMLHCTLVAAPGSALRSGPVELSIELPDGCPGADLQTAISGRYGTGALSVGRVPVAALQVGEGPLVQGAVLVDGAAPAGARDRAPLALAVHSGPGAGLVFPLRRGRFRIGRSGTGIVIPDAELSREHAQLEVTDSAVTLLDLGSANGCGSTERGCHAAAVSTESLISCGGSSMSLVFGGTVDPGGPTAAGSDVTAPLVVGNPAANSNRAALLLAAALPLAIGVGLAVLTGMWIFLAFTAVSAVSVLVPVASGRRQRRELPGGRRRGSPGRQGTATAGRTVRRRAVAGRCGSGTGATGGFCRRLTRSGCGSDRHRKAQISGWNRRIPGSAHPCSADCR